MKGYRECDERVQGMWWKCTLDEIAAVRELLRKLNLCWAKAEYACYVSAMRVDINEVESKSSVDKPVRVLWGQKPFTSRPEVGTEQSYTSCPLHDPLQELYLLSVRTEVCWSSRVLYVE